MYKVLEIHFSDLSFFMSLLCALRDPMELKKWLLFFLLLEYVCCNAESKCVKGCDVALASYYVSPGYLLFENITRLMESIVLSNSDVIIYNKDKIFNENVLAFSRLNIPFPCGCIDGEFLVWLGWIGGLYEMALGL